MNSLIEGSDWHLHSLWVRLEIASAWRVNKLLLLLEVHHLLLVLLWRNE